MTKQIDDILEETASKNLKLSQKQLNKFVKQAKALRHNLTLRKHQKEQRNKKNGCI